MYNHLRIPFLSLENYELEQKVVSIIPQEIAKEHKIIAIDNLANLLTIGICNLETKKILPQLEKDLKKKIMPFHISFDEWEKIMPTAYINKNEVKWIG